MTKYLITTDDNEPLGIVDGVCQVQALIEETIVSESHFPKFLEEFRIYELGKAQFAQFKLSDPIDEELI